MAGISRQELLRLARAGAAARVHELQAELDTIYRTFPDMKAGSSRKASDGNSTKPKSGAKKTARRAWTDADRKAVSDRMKKYWAARLGKAAKMAKTAKTAKAAR